MWQLWIDGIHGRLHLPLLDRRAPKRKGYRGVMPSIQSCHITADS